MEQSEIHLIAKTETEHNNDYRKHEGDAGQTIVNESNNQNDDQIQEEVVSETQNLEEAGDQVLDVGGQTGVVKTEMSIVEICEPDSSRGGP